MAHQRKYFSKIKKLLRDLMFYGSWMAPLFAFYYWHWKFAEGFFTRLDHSPWKFVFAATAWWVLSWIAMYFLQSLWPALLLIFFRTERERSPKKIIGIGDRFRKMGLSAPQIFILKENSRVWKNKVWGFFSLPSPLGALMLIDEAIAQNLTTEMLDFWICRKVIESRFSRFSSARFMFFTLVPTFTLVGAFAGSFFSREDLLITEAAAGGFFLLSVVIWRGFQIQRLHELDRKTVNDFHLDAKNYFDGLAESERHSPTRFLTKKFLGYNLEKRMAALDQPTKFKTWFLWALQPALLSALTLVFLFQTPLTELNAMLSTNNLSALAVIAPSVIKQVAPKETAQILPQTETTVSSNNKAPEAPAATMTPPEIKLSELSQAVLAGDMRLVLRQIGSGKNIHAGDPAANGATPLMLATKNGDLEMAYFLMTLGASAQTETDSLGQNILFYALQAPHRQSVVAYMLRTRVDSQQKSNEGLTALDQAKKNGWNDVIEALTSRGLASEPAAAAKTSPSN